jgi:hypothetical protein
MKHNQVFRVIVLPTIFHLTPSPTSTQFKHTHLKLANGATNLSLNTEQY